MARFFPKPFRPGQPTPKHHGSSTGPIPSRYHGSRPRRKDWNGHLKGYYISYRPAGSSDQHYHKTVEVHNPHQRQEIHLTNLRLSMSLQRLNPSLHQQGHRPHVARVPPSPPSLEVVSVSTSSVTLGWSLKTSFGNPVTGIVHSPLPRARSSRAPAAAVLCAEYVLHQRKEADHWQETPISTVQPVYTVRELECGTTYQFYMTAHNSLGRSEPSDVIRAKTDGAGYATLFLNVNLCCGGGLEEL
ncbi:hypothetical protein HPB48_003012 [Haemaphysalis longicornis]|uniref:Fibronectin type-III domain-containing protein n=1 Tax=Haemaphysalis longicornis TaxID=44386 RepID=A0A9J6F751_HAELO|nr:hypothetical protein HPB48_003012 [Haemaphysalis longicornis]